jgi:hypothetical protein
MDSYFKPNQDREPMFDYPNVKVLQYPFQHKVGWNGWFESTSHLPVLSTGMNSNILKQEYVTVLVRMIDTWVADTVIMDIDYLQILGAQNKVLYEFQFKGSIMMELIGARALEKEGFAAEK